MIVMPNGPYRRPYMDNYAYTQDRKAIMSAEVDQVTAIIVKHTRPKVTDGTGVMPDELARLILDAIAKSREQKP